MVPLQQEPAFLLELAASDELKHNMYISVNLQNAEGVKKLREIRTAAKNKEEEEKKKAKDNGKPAPPPATPPKHLYPEPLTEANIDKAKFQFHFLEHNWGHTCSLFDPKYCGRIDPTEKAEGKTYHVMKFTEFLRVFATHIKNPPKPSDPKDTGYQGRLPKLCMDWLIHKLVFQESEVVFTENKDETTKKTEPAAIARYVTLVVTEIMFWY